ncbi:hypothetical protein JCM10213_005954 [Rhodosporidiobolus nylandii]
MSAHRYSTSSFSSSEEDRRRPSSSRRISVSSSIPPPYDPPARRGSPSSSATTETEDEVYEAERAKRQQRREEREERAVASRTKKKGKQVHEMRSLGINRTQLKHILPGHKDDDSDDKVPLTMSAAAAQTDLEKQAAANRQKRRCCSTVSSFRLVHIVVAGLICLAIVAIGIVRGVEAMHDKEEKAEEFEEANPGIHFAAQDQLQNEAASAQSVLSWYVATTRAATGDEQGAPAASETEHTLSTSAPTSAPSVSTPAASVDSSLPSATGVFAQFPELQELFVGNREWRAESEDEDPGLIEELAQGQHPKIAYIGCADSRTPETTLFGAKPGVIFVTRNVGNQYLIDDLSSETVMSYAIAHLGVQHIVVMGHTECGAVQAAICAPGEEVNKDIGETRIDAWIRPIRSLYTTSNRTELVDFRTKMENTTSIAATDVTDEVWRALVEENVKLNVERVTSDSSVSKIWKQWTAQNKASSTSASSAGEDAVHRKRSSDDGKVVELWIHGWVYDVSTGLVHDLGVSVGPNGPYEGA